MKKLFLLLTLCVSCLCYGAESCDVKYILEKRSVDDGMYAIVDYSDVKEVEYLLVPTQIEEGKYNIKVTRVDSNIYRIEDTDFYIVTSMCLELSLHDDALLIVENWGGVSRGQIVFY